MDCYYWRTDLSSKIGPITIAADMFDDTDEDQTLDNGDWRYHKLIQLSYTSVTVSALDVPVGDATIGLDDEW